MTAESPSRPPLRYHGGKWMLAPWIIENFPEHRIYVEPFGGGASVLLRKARSYAEVYNDLDDEIVGFFRVLRDRRACDELIRLLRCTPFARVEWEAAYEPSTDPIERARRLIVRSMMGFGSASFNSDYSTGFRSNSNRSGTTPARDWSNYPDAIEGVADRFDGVVIENRPAVQIIETHDSAKTLFYLDPPYPHSTRNSSGSPYRHEMSDDDHRALAATARSVAGMVVISGYACDLYDRELFADWTRIERPSYAGNANGRSMRDEVLWINGNAEEVRRSRLLL